MKRKHMDSIETKAPKQMDSEQIRYSAAEEKIIQAIARELRAGEKAENRIGKLVAKLVTQAGGIRYGDGTVGKIAKHPSVGCSEQHLRLCWHYHLLITTYKGRISADITRLTRSAQFKIARLLKLQDNETVMMVVIDDCISETLKRGLTVDEVDEMVSRRLDDFGKLRKRSKAKKPSEPAVAKVVATDEFDLIDFADSISYMADPEKFDVHRVASGDTKRGLIRLICELAAISRRLLDSGPDHNLGMVYIKKGQELEEIGRSMLEPETKPAEA